MFKNLFTAIIQSKDKKDIYILFSNSWEDCTIFNLRTGEEFYEDKVDLENAGYSIIKSKEKDTFEFINKMDNKEKTGLGKIVSEFKNKLSTDFECQYNDFHEQIINFIAKYGTKLDLKNTLKLMNQNIKNYNENL